MRRPHGEAGLRTGRISGSMEGNVGNGRDKVCFVFGFHRSGTSALAGALARLGYGVGDFDNVASHENPRGFYEHPEFRAINESALAACGSAWWDASFEPTILQASGEALAPVLKRAEAFLDNVLERDNGPLLLKDPRAMQLMGFWEPLLTARRVESQRVVICREPSACVASQMRRFSQNPIFYAALAEEAAVYALWAAYHVNWLRCDPCRSAVFVRHDALVLEPYEILEALVDALGIRADRRSIESAAESILPALNRSADEGGGGRWREMADAIFAALPSVPVAGFDLNLVSKLEPVRAAEASCQLLLTPLASPAAELRDANWMRLLISQLLSEGPDPAAAKRDEDVIGDVKQRLLFRRTIGVWYRLSLALRRDSVAELIGAEILRLNPAADWVRRTLPSTRGDHDSI